MGFLAGILVGAGLSSLTYWWFEAFRYAKAWNAGREETYKADCEWNAKCGYPPPPPGSVMVAK